jgi:hypothetical protein
MHKQFQSQSKAGGFVFHDVTQHQAHVILRCFLLFSEEGKQEPGGTAFRNGGHTIEEAAQHLMAIDRLEEVISRSFNFLEDVISEHVADQLARVMPEFEPREVP